MCTGRPPFRGDNVAVVAKRICDECPSPIDEINPEIPRWLVETVDRLLEKDPDRRFQTAAEVAEALSGQLAYTQQPQAGRVPPPVVKPAARGPATMLRPAASREGHPPWRERVEQALGRPWNVAGWLVVVLLVLLVFIPCLIVIPLALWIPAYQSRQAASDMSSLTINYDPTMPIIEIEVLRGDSNVGQVYPVASRPIFLRFPTGQYDLAIRYEHGPKRYTLEKSFTIPGGAEQAIDLSLAIQNDFNQKLNDDRLPPGLPGSENSGDQQ
jgi:serine/threonine protein kinase